MDKTYRYPVFPVTSCPTNARDWEQAAKQRNCSLNGVRNTYLCLPNEEKTTLLEFCYDEVRPMVQKDNCIELAGSGTINQYGCTMFTAGCPKNPYFSDFIYNHSSCLNINTQEGCYHEDPSCPNKTFNGLERDLTYHTTGKYWIAGLVIGILVLIAVFALIISRRRIYRFRRSRKEERRYYDDDDDFPSASTGCASSLLVRLDPIEYAQPKVSNPAPPPPPPPPSNT